MTYLSCTPQAAVRMQTPVDPTAETRSDESLQPADWAITARCRSANIGEHRQSSAWFACLPLQTGGSTRRVVVICAHHDMHVRGRPISDGVSWCTLRGYLFHNAPYKASVIVSVATLRQGRLSGLTYICALPRASHACLIPSKGLRL